MGGWLARRPILNFGLPTISQGAGACDEQGNHKLDDHEGDLQLVLLLHSLLVKLEILGVDVVKFLPLLGIAVL